MSKMDRKPWQNNGPHRAPFGSDRREGGRSDRREGGERGFGRREFGERRGFGDRRQSFGGGQRRREDFGVRSGPRARALETRRFSERSDFAKNAVVKLDADIADYFKSAEDVNKALRLVIELGRLAKKPEVKTEAEKVEQAEAPAVATEEAMFTEDVFEDEEEDVETVAEAEETVEAKSEDKAE